MESKPEQIRIFNASISDCKILAQFNRRLIEDGGAINSMNDNQLIERMQLFINSNEYDVLLFVHNSIYIGYTLINKQRNPLFIRHFYIDRNFRRKGYGRIAFNQLVSLYDTDQFDLTVLQSNTIGYMFWESCGLFPYEIYMHFRK